MAGGWRLFLFVVGWTVWSIWQVPAWGEPRPVPVEMLEDAELHDVFFRDPLRGWAVGDRGVVWHTEDGGAHWHRQSSGVTCSLRSIHFVDARHGWIVGGWIHPYSHRSSGVVLRTEDGGARWTKVEGPTLPMLHRVQFVSPLQGWGISDGSGVYPSGLLRTEDGGRGWSALPSVGGGGWRVGDFRDERDGIVAEPHGAIAIVRQQVPRSVESSRLDWRRPRDITIAARDSAWLVGDGGLLLRSSDGGASWSDLSDRLPEGTRDQVDLRTIACFRNHVWIAGSPGSLILHSSDAGASWTAYLTGHSTPLRAVTFVDDKRGWAVGALGAILSTADGGRNWRRQRAGGGRVAVLGIFRDVPSVPMEWISKWSAGEGYLSAVEVVGRRDLEPVGTDRSSADERLREAVVRVGGSSSHVDWRFPLRQAGLDIDPRQVLRAWDADGDGDAADRLRESLVAKIRMWRPAVVLTESASPHRADSLAHVINQTVLAAVEQAADARAYSGQSRAGLEPWDVQRVACVLEGDRSGTVNLSTVELLPRLGRSIADHSETGRRLLFSEIRPRPAEQAFRVVVDRLSTPGARGDLLAGVGLGRGDARRPPLTATHGDLQSLHQVARKRRNVQRILSSPGGRRSEIWLSQIDDLTRGLEDNDAGEILFQLGSNYRAVGKYETAADVLQLLVKRYPRHDLVEPSVIWLMEYLVSGEVAWRDRRRSTARTSYVEFEPAAISSEDREQVGPIPGAAAAPRFRVDDGPAAPIGEPADRTSEALMLGKLIHQTRPGLYSEPELRFPLAVAHRRHGVPREAESYFRSLAAGHGDSPWGLCARGELWWEESRPERPSPKPAGTCRPAAGKPYLDGRLNDPVWKEAESFALESPLHDAASWPAVVQLAHDQQYLFLAIQCRKAPGGQYEIEQRPRRRDDDLELHDRVELLIDVDRDYGSWYRLTVDHRGWAGEACMDDPSWDPEWFVAAGSDEEYWTVEAAVPWSELVPEAPRGRDMWAIGIQRVVPNVGFQSWSRPAAAEEARPEGFGLLRFAGTVNRPASRRSARSPGP